MATRDFCSFIKIGEENFMKQLLNEGEVFCKTLHYFKTIEQDDLRGDKNDGAAYVRQMKNISLFIENKLVAIATSGQTYHWHPEDLGNIYCVYALPTEKLDLTSPAERDLELDMSGLTFGDTAILIYEPEEFIKRIKKEVEAQGFPIQFSPVNYYDEKTYEGELSPFYKSQKYKSQNELRFWIPNKANFDLRFKIGSISDIAVLLKKSDLYKMSYCPL